MKNDRVPGRYRSYELLGQAPSWRDVDMTFLRAKPYANMSLYTQMILQRANSCQTWSTCAWGHRLGMYSRPPIAQQWLTATEPVPPHNSWWDNIKIMADRFKNIHNPAHRASKSSLNLSDVISSWRVQPASNLQDTACRTAAQPRSYLLLSNQRHKERLGIRSNLCVAISDALCL